MGRITNYYFCLFFLVAIAYEATSLSADLSHDYLEQVNERMNRLEKKMENIESYLMEMQKAQQNKAIAHKQATLESGLKEEKMEVQQRLKTRVDELEEAVQGLTNKVSIMDTVEEIRKVTEYVCPKGHCFETKTEDGKCSICGLQLKETTNFKKFKFARRKSISERIATALEEEFKKRILLGASGTGIFQQILNDGKSRSSSAEGSLDLLFIGRPLANMMFFVDLEAIGGNGPDETISSLSNLNADAGSLQDSDGVDRRGIKSLSS